MTLNKAAWAIDGPITNAALARVESYAQNPEEGVVSFTDLKVRASGSGLKISSGAARVLNRYQDDPNQIYTIANNGDHTVGIDRMPPSNPAEQTYIVAIAVGDPEFSQVGHPYMPSVFTADPSTFEYVRPIVVLESSFNTRKYPAVRLARLVIPANQTVMSDSYITDLRNIPRPRVYTAQGNVSAPVSEDFLTARAGQATPTERFPKVTAVTVKIPQWATKAKIMGFVEGLRLDKSGSGKLWAQVEGTGATTIPTNIEEVGSLGRRSYNVGGEIDVTTLRGQTRNFAVYGSVNDAASSTFLVSTGATSVALAVSFVEEPS